MRASQSPPDNSRDRVANKKRSERMKQLWADPAFREARTGDMKPKWQDPAYRNAVVVGRQNQWQRPGYRERMGVVIAAAQANPEYRARMSAAVSQARMARPELRAASAEFCRQWAAAGGATIVAEASKLQWAILTQEERDRKVAPMLAACSPRVSNLEQQVADVLGCLGIPYEQQMPFGRGSVDFYLTGTTVVIECDGEYWHTRPGVLERDSKKDMALAECGYTLVRLPERAIKEDCRGAVKNRVLPLLEVGRAV